MHWMATGNSFGDTNGKTISDLPSQLTAARLQHQGITIAGEGVLCYAIFADVVVLKSITMTTKLPDELALQSFHLPKQNSQFKGTLNRDSVCISKRQWWRYWFFSVQPNLLTFVLAKHASNRGRIQISLAWIMSTGSQPHFQFVRLYSQERRGKSKCLFWYQRNKAM